MLRIQPGSGDDGPSLEITRMLVNGRNTSFLPRNTEGFIFADKEIPRDGVVYKTSGKCKDYSARIGELKLEKPLMDLSISLSRSACTVAAEYSSGRLFWEKKLELAEAAKAPLSEDRIREEFASLDVSGFRAGKIEISIKENPFLPASV